jgi:predicted deacylase
VSESSSSVMVNLPVHVRRGPEEGPVVFVTAALHGDEINGTGAIRQLIADDSVSAPEAAASSSSPC